MSFVLAAIISDSPRFFQAGIEDRRPGVVARPMVAMINRRLDQGYLELVDDRLQHVVRDVPRQPLYGRQLEALLGAGDGLAVDELAPAQQGDGLLEHAGDVGYGGV